MVDVVEQLDCRRVDGLYDAESPLKVITLVVRMINAAVEQFQYQRYARVLGSGGDAAQPFGGDGRALVVRLTGPVAAEADQIGNALGGSQTDAVLHLANNPAVVGAAVETFFDGGVAVHGRDPQAEVPRPAPQFLRHEFHGGVADPGRARQEGVGVCVVARETPPGKRLS